MLGAFGIANFFLIFASRFQRAFTVEVEASYDKLFEQQLPVLESPVNLGKRWPRDTPVPFRFEFRIPLPSRHKIRTVLKEIESKSCIRFLENPREDLGVPLVRVINDKTCWSRVGPHFEGPVQNISIPFGCTDSFGVIAHEILHLLGFEHTQSRADRDQHIHVFASNIKPSELRQYRKQFSLPSVVYKLPYELGSVMHYGAYGNGINQSMPSIIPLDRRYLKTLGQRIRITFLDFVLLNRLYGCYENPDCDDLACQNGGVPIFKDTCTCFCPDGFSGGFCDELTQSTAKNPKCSVELKAKPSWQRHQIQLDSGVRNNGPNLFMPEECWVHIKTASGSKIELQFQDFKGKCDRTCTINGVEIKLQNFEQTGIRDCCKEELLKSRFRSSGELLVLGAFARNNQTLAAFKYRRV
ncbi:unnamed protein product, partial [Mesorhabditis spiculigera]